MKSGLHTFIGNLAVVLSLFGCGVGIHGEDTSLESVDLTTPIASGDASNPLLGSRQPMPGTRTEFFQQLVDHSSQASGKTFKQRYLINSSEAAGADAPVLLLLCGEFPCTADVVSLFMAAHAKHFKAHVVALEHRYYGESFPVPDLTPDNLRFLTTEHALADTATFIRAMRQNPDLRGPWLVIGASYSGMLAAYLRSRHPELVVGALASSAPVRVKESFEECDAFIGQGLGTACTDATRRYAEAVDAAGAEKSAKYAAILAAFGQKPDMTPADFANNVISQLSTTAVQFNLDKAGYCQAVQSDDPTPGLVRYYQASKQLTGMDSDLSATALPPPTTVAGRMWFWQTCKEYGFWQTALADRSRSAFSKLLTVDYFRGFCARTYGLTVPADVAGTNSRYYQPLVTSATRILFTNGDSDPWSSMSLRSDTPEALQRDVHTYVIAGGSHSDDLLYPDRTDSASLKGARAKFQDLAARWLKGP